MNWNLRREEVLNGEQLREMLNHNPSGAAQAILGAGGEQVD